MAIGENVGCNTGCNTGSSGSTYVGVTPVINSFSADADQYNFTINFNTGIKTSDSDFATGFRIFDPDVPFTIYTLTDVDVSGAGNGVLIMRANLAAPFQEGTTYQLDYHDTSGIFPNGAISSVLGDVQLADQSVLYTVPVVTAGTLFNLDFIDAPEAAGMGIAGATPKKVAWTPNNPHVNSGYIDWLGGQTVNTYYNPSTSLDTPDDLSFMKGTGTANGVHELYNAVLCSNRPEIQGSPIGLSDGDVWGVDHRLTASFPQTADLNMSFVWAGQTEVYMRWYVKFDSTFYFSAGQYKYLAHFGHDQGTPATSNTCNFGLDSLSGGPSQSGTFYFNFSNSNTGFDSDGRMRSNTTDWLVPNTAPFTDQVTLFAGNDEWYEVEIHIKQASGTGIADGQVDLWINGKHNMELIGIPNWGSNAGLLRKTSYGIVWEPEVYPLTVGHMYTKNITIATSRIGVDR